MPEFCKKHPQTEMIIRRGKNQQRFVVCPECKPDPATKNATPKTDPPAAKPAAEKKNEEPGHVPWYDRIVIG